MEPLEEWEKDLLEFETEKTLEEDKGPSDKIEIVKRKDGSLIIIIDTNEDREAGIQTTYIGKRRGDPQMIIAVEAKTAVALTYEFAQLLKE